MLMNKPILAKEVQIYYDCGDQTEKNIARFLELNPELEIIDMKIDFVKFENESVLHGFVIYLQRSDVKKPETPSCWER
ncbi:hypothetical protein [Dehalococcoides mccartyi]|uniref:Uncharacterized protein n=1 Tax=Dehalococcoides mccartyi TaxID=61435 RepID=A0A142VAN1_9CHLR|nr:hypothetical protein [Dehalococcoides mccartyi]AGG07964.1 hypothetical protein btf_877 [Dehalococcoides mccartyi BTF08]AMU86661.1 hypothetical protein Dm11a5_0835 [Dehalococcoides mccartyi]AQU05946.1 hypothetical protein B1777_04435 [Dehalococcoides mccartyi]AQU07391.1 hypothetical protein B1778_04250 [Dehalococcoides mccartyi]